MDNARIADRLDAFAALLELAEANPYQPRAYRRAAETIRSTRVPVADLVARGPRARAARHRARDRRRGCEELIDTGEIAELAELERDLSPDLVGLGRYLGLGAKRSVEIARALGVRTADELREAAAAGRLRTAPGVGPKTEARLLEALAREGEPRPRRGCCSTARWELVGGIADALDGESAGDVRRWRDSCERLAVVVRRARPGAALAALRRAAADRRRRRAGGAAGAGRDRRGRAGRAASSRSRSGSAPRCCGPPARPRTSRRSSRCPTRPTRRPSTRRSALPGARRSCASSRSATSRRRSSSVADIRGDLHCHTTWSDGRASVEEMGRAARERGYDYIAICDHTPAVGAVPGPDRRRRPPPGRGDRRRERACWRRSASCAGSSATSCPTGGSTSPTTCSPSSTGSRPACTAGSGCRATEMTRRVEEALRNPHVRCLSHPTGPDHQPPAGERARPRARVRGRARARRRARGQRPRAAARPQRRARPRGAARRRADRRARPTRTRSAACEHDARRSHTARRGGATAADVVNAGPLERP